MNCSDLLARVAMAIEALPREKRPYMIRDLSPGDVMTDLAPFLDPAIEETVRKAVLAERERCTALAQRWAVDASPSCGLRDMPGGAPPHQAYAAIDELINRMLDR